MSRSGYSDDCDYDYWAHIRWRGQVASAIRGKRGQAFLRELVAALDALSEKKLIANDLQRGPHVCAIGSGLARGVDMSAIDPEDYDRVADVFGIAHQLVREIEWFNDETYADTPEKRWEEMRAWAVANIKSAPAEQVPA